MKKPKIKLMLPKKGSFSVQAKKGIVLPVMYDGRIQRITSEKHMQMSADALPYETRVILERALRAEDIRLVDMKKYLEEKSKKMRKPSPKKSAKDKTGGKS